MHRFLPGQILACWLFVANFTQIQAQCALSCVSSSQVSLPSNGSATITPNMILTTAYPQGCSPQGPAAFVVTVMGPNGLPISGSPTITCANVGQTLTVKVMHSATQNACWGSIHVEDKLAPAIVCADKTVSCAVSNLEPTNPLIGYPTVSDNCDQNVTLTKSDLFTDLNCTQSYNGTFYSGYLTRTWTAVDDYGNYATCVQKIFLERKTVWQVVFPKNLDGYALPALQCSPPPNTQPAATGYPTIDNVPIQAGSFCELKVAHTDQNVPICDGTFKILRTWTVIDHCNNMIKSSIQIIKIVDDKPPVFACPADFTASIDGNICSATVNFPPISVSDNCSSATSVKITTPFGTINANGGTLPNIPAGTHTVTYMATDNCNNFATCSMKITVKDDAPPIAICDGFTVTSLTNAGTVTIPAAALDDGSYDNCCPKPTLVFKVKKMNDPGQFGSSVTFKCADVGQVQVILRVCDCNGNYNDCMVIVEVQDKISPIITCPPNKILECKDYSAGGNLGQQFGNATATDNCSTPTVLELPPVFNLSTCGIGSILRTFKATDGGGRTATCTQTISIINSTPYNGTQIMWPPDYAITACATPDSLAPTKLPAPFNQPNLGNFNSVCSQLGVNFTDEVFQIAPPACWKILRKWVIIDWCQHNPNVPNSPGRWEYTQTLKIMDTTPPVFVNPPANLTFEVGANCLATVILPQPTATDCSANLSFVAQSPFGNGFGTFNNVSIGEYAIKYFVYDGCGNQATHTFKVFVRDLKPPTPVCLNGLSVNLMNSGMVVLWATDFNAGSSTDNCTPQNLLKYSFTPNLSITNDTFTCENVGTNIVKMYVTDAFGNQSFCETYVIVQDNFGICPNNQTAQMAGLVKNEKNQDVELVKMELSGGSNAVPVITGSDGSWAFPSLPINGNYVVKPSKIENPLNGITVFDMVKLQKHVLNIEKLASPYLLIAADINHNGAVTTADVVELRKLILGIYNDFPANKSWRFVDANWVFSDPTKPFLDAFPETKTVNNLPSNGAMGNNFIGIKVGDLTGDAVPNNAVLADDRTAGTLDLSLENRDFLLGERFAVTLKMADFEKIEGLQLTLGWNTDALFLENLQPANGFDLSNFNLLRTQTGVLPMVFENIKKSTQSIDNELVTFHFLSKSSGKISENIHLLNEFTKPAAWQNSEKKNLELTFKNKQGQSTAIAEQTLELRQNQPNPWLDETTIRYILPTSGDDAIIRIFDAAGRQIRTFILPTENTGYGEITLQNADFSASGVYQIRLETSKQVLVKRMVKI
jgi:HYR domain